MTRRTPIPTPVRVLAALSLAAVALASCDGEPAATNTREQVEAVSPLVEQLDGVRDATVTTEGSTGVELTDVIVVRVILTDDVTSRDRAAEVLDRAIEVVWHSDVPVVSSIAATARGFGLDDQVTEAAFFDVPSVGRDQLAERYGPR